MRRLSPGPYALHGAGRRDRKSTRLNSSHGSSSYAVFCLKKKKTQVALLEALRERPQLITLARTPFFCSGRPYVRSSVLPEDSMAGGFFFNDTATTEIYTLSLHDALPI